MLCQKIASKTCSLALNLIDILYGWFHSELMNEMINYQEEDCHNTTKPLLVHQRDIITYLGGKKPAAAEKYM